MKLYHGSNTDFSRIDLSWSKKGKDFGTGFYMSEELEQAKKIATIRKDFLGGEACVHVYNFDRENAQKELKILVFDGYCREWAQFIFDNRSNRSHINLHDYDIVYGPIANDNVGYQVRRLMDGVITIDEFFEEIKYMQGETFQYLFATSRSLSYLDKINTIKVW